MTSSVTSPELHLLTSNWRWQLLALTGSGSPAALNWQFLVVVSYIGLVKLSWGSCAMVSDAALRAAETHCYVGSEGRLRWILIRCFNVIRGFASKWSARCCARKNRIASSIIIFIVRPTRSYAGHAGVAFSGDGRSETVHRSLPWICHHRPLPPTPTHT